MKYTYLFGLMIIPLATSCCNKNVVHDGKASYPEVTTVDVQEPMNAHPSLTPTRRHQRLPLAMEEEQADTSVASLTE